MFVLDHMSGLEGAPVLPPGAASFTERIPASDLSFANWSAGLRRPVLPVVALLSCHAAFQDRLIHVGALHRIILMILDPIIASQLAEDGAESTGASTRPDKDAEDAKVRATADVPPSPSPPLVGTSRSYTCNHGRISAEIANLQVGVKKGSL